jgi:uncharacterized protein
MKKINILSIDGGGIRGVMPAVIVVELEKMLQVRLNNPSLKIGDVFDLIAGTSTGGILACLYLAPGADGHPKYSAQQALDLYVRHGHEIFARSWVKWVESADGVTDEKYNYANLYKLLDEYFGEQKLSQFVKPSLITSYDITGRQAVFFTSVDAVKYPSSNFKIKDVARSTSAAPTYFEPSHVQSDDGKSWTLVDGGVFANNPALCAYSEALKIDFPAVGANPAKGRPSGAKDMLLVSLGTGSVKKSYHYDHFKRAGAVKWLEPVIDILMSGNSETVTYELQQIYGTLADANDKNSFYRLEPALLEACSEMDVATPENIGHLQDAGLDFVAKHRDQLNEIVEKVAVNCG